MVFSPEFCNPNFYVVQSNIFWTDWWALALVVFSLHVCNVVSGFSLWNDLHGPSSSWMGASVGIMAQYFASYCA
jgi:hypothetical protein